jgi:hypothetical protein
MSLPSNTGYSGSDKDEWGSLAGLPSPAPHHGFLLFFFFFFFAVSSIETSDAAGSDSYH